MPFTIDDRAIKSLVRDLDTLDRRGRREIERAVVDTRRRTLAESSRDIRRQYAIKVSPLKKNLRAEALGRLGFRIVGSPKSQNITDFTGTRQLKRKGLVFAVERGQTVNIPHGFIRNGKAFKRVSRNGKIVGRLPIRGVTGPTAADMLAQPRRLSHLDRYVRETLFSILDRRYLRLLDRV